ncbi:MAG: ABC transporter ATP-binding protein [Thermodesulfobacteriota bacterium]
MTPDIEAIDVYKSFKAVDAVKGISLSIGQGQFTALLGPNGAGKTTLVEMIEGIQVPDSGEIRILGKPWKGNQDELHRAIGLCLQETRFIDKLSVREILRMFAGFYNLGKQRVDEIMDIVGMTDKKDAYAVNLSGGQRQRLALGIALLNRPKILLLDEPTTGLDPNARREIWAILRDLKQQAGTSLVLTTHYMEEAEQLCDYIMIIDQGRVLTEGTMEELLAEDTSEKVIEFTLDDAHPPVEELQRKTPFQINWDTNGRGTIAVSDIENQLPAFFDYLRRENTGIKNMECRRKTLDDLFTDMTGRRLND